jgi:protein-tyrosine-phosphatase
VILVLCHGNVNRSPACEAVLRSIGVDATSAGFTHAGRRAAGKMRREMARHGYDLAPHRTRTVTREMVLDPTVELLVYMDVGNYRRLSALLEGVPASEWPRTVCLGTYIGAPRIEDPAFMRDQSPEFIATTEGIIRASLELARTLP